MSNQFEKEQNWRTHTSRFQEHYKATYSNPNSGIKTDVYINGIKQSLKINPHIYYQFVFDKSAKANEQ